MKQNVEKEWYTTQEVCTYLGISAPHLYRMMRLEQFPKPVKIGRTNKWSKTFVNEFLYSKMPKFNVENTKK